MHERLKCNIKVFEGERRALCCEKWCAEHSGAAGLKLRVGLFSRYKLDPRRLLKISKQRGSLGFVCSAVTK